jgi:hypothetical protein
LLRTKFVPVAVDLHVMLSKAADPQERAFYDKVTAEIQKNSEPIDGGGQGAYFFTAEGKVLGGQKLRYEGKTWEEQAKAALQEFEEQKKNLEEDTVKNVAKTTPASRPTVPDGALVVRVSKRVIGGYQKKPGERVYENGSEKISEEMEQLYQRSTGYDNLWIRQDEAAELARGRLPHSLQIRIARHLYDSTRSQLWSAFWARDQVKKVELTLAQGEIKGSVHVESPDGDRGYVGSVRGMLEVRDGKVTRFDLVAKGSWWEDEIRPTSPKKSIQILAIAFRLNDNEMTRLVPPEGALVLPEDDRNDDYLR